MKEFYVELSNTQVSNDCITVWNYLMQNPNCTLEELRNNFNDEKWVIERRWKVTFCSNLVYVLKRLKEVKCIEIVQNRNTGGEFDYATINLLAEPIIRKDVLICTECNMAFKKKGYGSKYKSICYDCTVVKFMSPKISTCGFCGIDAAAKSMRSSNGVLYHVKCLEKHKERIKTQLSDRFTKRRYCPKCNVAEIGKYARSCNNCRDALKKPSRVCEVCNAVITKNNRGTNESCRDIRCMAISIIKNNSFFNNRLKGTCYDLKKAILGKSCIVCGYESFIHYHHVVFLENGGTDTIKNFVPLCPNHHSEVHHCGLDITEYHQQLLKRMDGIVSGAIAL